MKKLSQLLNESITLDVKVGDILLMGKFLNKRVEVKEIGKDEHGMPTVNGKKTRPNSMYPISTKGVIKPTNYAWKKELSATEKLMVVAMTQESRKKLGYPWKLKPSKMDVLIGTSQYYMPL